MKNFHYCLHLCLIRYLKWRLDNIYMQFLQYNIIYIVKKHSHNMCVILEYIYIFSKLCMWMTPTSSIKPLRLTVLTEKLVFVLLICCRKTTRDSGTIWWFIEHTWSAEKRDRSEHNIWYQLLVENIKLCLHATTKSYHYSTKPMDALT